MNVFDEYVESLLHFNLNFYLAFSPERGRTVGELVTIISSALARSGVSCTAAEVNQSIEERIAIQDGFVQASHDKIWLNFVSSLASAQPIPPALPTASGQPSPVPMVAMATAPAAVDPPATDVASAAPLATGSISWEQQIWNTDFVPVAAAEHDVNAPDFPIRLLVAAYGKLRNVANEPFKEEYLQRLLDVLNNLVPGNKLNRLSLARVVSLTNFGETSTKPVMFASGKVIALLTGWIAKKSN